MSDGDPGLEWLLFYNGSDPAATKTVCHLPRELRDAIGAHSSTIRISRSYVQKGVHKHGLAFSHFSMLKYVILEGEVYKDRKQQLVFFFRAPASMRNYLFVALKAVHSGSEVWVKSIHWKDETDRGRVVRKSTLIRPRKE